MPAPTGPWLWGALLLAALVGALTLDGGFVLDDGSAISGSPVVTGAVSVAEGLTRDFWGQPLDHPASAWRPLLPLVWRGLWALGGGAAWPFRLLSLLLHVGLVASAFAQLRRLVTPTVAGMAAVLLAVHPARSEAVGALVAQADLAALALGCWAVVALLDGRAWRAAGWLLIGCLAKESAVVVVPLAVVALWTRGEPGEPAALRRALRQSLPVLAVAVAVAALHLALPKAAVMPQDNLALAASGAGERLLHGLATVGRAVWLVAVPLDLAPHHGYAAVDLSPGTLAPWAALGAATLAALALSSLRSRAVAPLATLAGVTLLLTSNLIVRLPTDVAERLLLPVVLAAAAGLAALVARTPRPPVVLCGVVAALLPLTWLGQRPWASEAALWEHALLTEPRAMRTQRNASAMALREGREDDALWHLMVLRHLERSLPNPLDWALVEGLAVRPDRLALGPGAFAPDAPCAFALEWLNGAFRDPAEALAQWELFRGTYGCPSLRP